LQSIDFLKGLLDLAKDLAGAERNSEDQVDSDRGVMALTDLFNEVKSDKVPVIVERIVADIDDIVRQVRFVGWQATHAGEREVKKALRSTLMKYKLHHDNDLFDRAYGYIRQYYAM